MCIYLIKKLECYNNSFWLIEFKMIFFPFIMLACLFPKFSSLNMCYSSQQQVYITFMIILFKKEQEGLPWWRSG